MTSADRRLRGPVLLRPDNFAPLARTPWGGDVIGRQFKSALVPGSMGQKIGEAWEFSCDGTFPSRLVDGGTELSRLVAEHPEAVLSPARVRAGATSIDILVKLLDAAEPLSWQVHPADDNSSLKVHEGGKPESWLVLAAAPGAGIYLGFSKAMSRSELQDALLSGRRVKDLMHFEPVGVGDYFDIGPGVPHAIGPGLTLLEPQRVVSHLTGKTFRMWDWDRRYDRSGQLDPNGEFREMHVDQSVAIVDPERQVGRAFAMSLRRTPAVTERPGVKASVFPANSYYQTAVFDLAKGASIDLSIKDGYGALLMLAGTVRSGDVALTTGQPALLPYVAMPLTIAAASDCRFALVTPAFSPVSF